VQAACSIIFGIGAEAPVPAKAGLLPREIDATIKAGKRSQVFRPHPESRGIKS
jgi:hypothetical protein